MHQRSRLRRRSDFAAVYRKGRAWATDLLVLRALPNGLTHNRYGYAVSRKVGKAVVRNRVRRRLREAVRALPLREGWDMVVIARPPAAEAPFAGLMQALRAAAFRGRLVKDGGETA